MQKDLSNTQNNIKCIPRAGDRTFAVKGIESLKQVVKIIESFGFVSETKKIIISYIDNDVEHFL